jgi:hypothetical protein
MVMAHADQRSRRLAVNGAGDEAGTMFNSLRKLFGLTLGVNENTLLHIYPKQCGGAL